MSDWNSTIIEEFRSNGGHVTAMGFGKGLVIMHTIGAKSGAERLNPVMGLPTEGGWLVAASKAGAPDEPGWAHNLRAHPDLVVEVPGDHGVEEVGVHATELTGAARDTAWERFKAAAPGFGEYEKRTDRIIAVFALDRS